MAFHPQGNTPPAPAYFPTSSNSPLHPPKELYDKLRNLSHGDLVKKESFVVPPRSGKAWHVPKGCILRLSTPEGPQVGDLNIWNAHDPRERFWAARTRQLQGSHMIEGDRLWSNLPFMRPLCGIIRDGCAIRDGPGNGKNGGREENRDGRGGMTKWGGRCHDLLGTRCDPYGICPPFARLYRCRLIKLCIVSNMLGGADYDFHCHSNLVRAILPYGLTEFDVHDVLNVFQITGLDPQGRYFMEASPATTESFIEFFAEQDLLCALSTCPGGDLSAWGWHQADATDEKQDMKATCRPIAVEVWEIKESVQKEVLSGWKRPGRSAYKGVHGMRIPEGER